VSICGAWFQLQGSVSLCKSPSKVFAIETQLGLLQQAFHGTARHGTARHGTARHGTLQTLPSCGTSVQLLDGIANLASGVDCSVLLAHCILEALSTEST